MRFIKHKFSGVSFPPERVEFPATFFVRVLSVLLTVALLIFGIIGLISSYLNPVTFLLPYVNNCYSLLGNTVCGAKSSLIPIEPILDTLNGYPIPTIIISGIMAIVGLLQPSFRRFVISIFRKFIAIYKSCLGVRNYIIDKIELLNSESKKWKQVFTVIKSPYSLLRAMGLSPNMAISALAIGGAATGGVAINETVFAERSFSRGDSGIYSAPKDTPLSLTAKNVPQDIETVLKTEQNTLAIILGAIPVREIKIENVSVGAIYKGSAGNDAGNTSAIPASCDATNPAKTGNTLCPAILVSGVPAAAAAGETPAVVATRIRIAEMTLSRSRCKEIIFEDVDAHTIEISYNTADGLSIYQSAGTAPRRNAMGGHHQAENMTTSGGTYDRLLIVANSSGVNGEIGKLDLSNIYSKGSICLFKNLDIGTLKITENEAGDDNTLSTKEFLIRDSVLGANWSVVDNIEINMIEPTIEVANP